ncbi:A24 family peptidase [Streptococcus sp. DD12]|uniref:A24 family peptidase n=1 Tax=Streptococcus sp. DD12 TaxID=1777880 RepID=UPI00079BE471|nr:A24 family peptidase [Streptococcus sp. DD12]KXT76774.1 Late competence protein ComC, processing protease [Streptococcus sp. DD12]
MKTLILFSLGACLGSFLGLVADRFPDQSIIGPASHCGACQRRLAAWQLVPIVSQTLLKSRCFYCRAPFALRYLLVEILCACLFGLWSVDILSGTTLWLAIMGVLLGLFDIKSRQYPLVIWIFLTLPLLMSAKPTVGTWILLALGLFATFRPFGMGNGDFLFLATLSLNLSLMQLLLLIQLASLIAIAYAYYYKQKSRLIPFVPFMTGAYCLMALCQWVS